MGNAASFDTLRLPELSIEQRADQSTETDPGILG
jgi:hypothetical protein